MSPTAPHKTMHDECSLYHVMILLVTVTWISQSGVNMFSQCAYFSIFFKHII